jgi:hypothetical protein
VGDFEAAIGCSQNFHCFFLTCLLGHTEIGYIWSTFSTKPGTASRATQNSNGIEMRRHFSTQAGLWGYLVVGALANSGCPPPTTVTEYCTETVTKTVTCTETTTLPPTTIYPPPSTTTTTTTVYPPPSTTTTTTTVYPPPSTTTTTTTVHPPPSTTTTTTTVYPPPTTVYPPASTTTVTHTDTITRSPPPPVTYTTTEIVTKPGPPGPTVYRTVITTIGVTATIPGPTVTSVKTTTNVVPGQGTTLTLTVPAMCPTNPPGPTKTVLPSLEDVLIAAGCKNFLAFIKSDREIWTLFNSNYTHTVFAPSDEFFTFNGTIGTSPTFTSRRLRKRDTQQSPAEARYQAGIYFNGIGTMGQGDVMQTNLFTANLGGAPQVVVANGVDAPGLTRRDLLDGFALHARQSQNSSQQRLVTVDSGLGDVTRVIKGDLQYQGGLVQVVNR